MLEFVEPTNMMELKNQTIPLMGIQNDVVNPANYFHGVQLRNWNFLDCYTKGKCQHRMPKLIMANGGDSWKWLSTILAMVVAAVVVCLELECLESHSMGTCHYVWWIPILCDPIVGITGRCCETNEIGRPRVLPSNSFSWISSLCCCFNLESQPMCGAMAHWNEVPYQPSHNLSFLATGLLNGILFENGNHVFF